jgi:Glycosyl transferase family 2
MISGGTPTPRVSVIMPVFNGGRFLAAAVESVLKQSFDDFEFIVIDDGSTDQSSALLLEASRSDHRVRLLSQANSGVVVALNRALELARGEYIARMDADDVALPPRFARQVAFLDAHPDVAVVGSAIRLIDEEGRTIRDVDYPLTPAEVSEFLIEVGCALAHPAVMMRRVDVAGAGGYRSAYRHAEDYDLWLRMSETRALANLPDRLLLYRQHPGKASARYATAQMLATHLARLCAKKRRSGQPDPLAGRSSLSLDDLDCFDLGVGEREAIMRDVIGPAPAAIEPPAATPRASFKARARHAAVRGLRRVLPAAWFEWLRDRARERRSLA